MEFKSYEEFGVNSLLLNETQISAALNNIHPLHKSMYEKLLELKNKGTVFGCDKKTYLLIKNFYSTGGDFEKFTRAMDCYPIREHKRTKENFKLLQRRHVSSCARRFKKFNNRRNDNK